MQPLAVSAGWLRATPTDPTLQRGPGLRRRWRRRTSSRARPARRRRTTTSVRSSTTSMPATRRSTSPPPATDPELPRALVSAGADVSARNRLGAQPLHYAADGVPGGANWNPNAQAAIVAFLIEAGADPNVADRRGVTPLHRAVRTRCAAAVSALLDGGADPRRKNGNGTTPMQLATRNTGRGGSAPRRCRKTATRDRAALGAARRAVDSPGPWERRAVLSSCSTTAGAAATS